MYSVGLLSGMSIVERRGHSIDQYGEQRYFELGRDAAVEFAYLDLRFRNDFSTTILLETAVEQSAITASAWASERIALDVEVVTSDEGDTGEELRVGTVRTVRTDARGARVENLGTTCYKKGY